MLLLLSYSASSQVTSNKGTDFWIGYMGHIDGTGSNMKLYVTSDVATSGVVSIPGQNWSQNFSVSANSVTLLNIPPASAYVGCDDCIENKGIHLVANDPVVVYSHIHANARSDATLVLPTTTLGRDYYAMSFTQASTGSAHRNQFMVLATEDSTLVEITPTANNTTGFRQANTTFTVSLNKGEVYQYRSTSDITGSRLLSVSSGSGGCKRISVFSGSSFTVLGCTGAGSGDNLYQQMYPVSAWGKEFITVPMKTRTGGDYFRVLASADNTQVYVNNTFQKNLQKGQYHEFLSSTANYIRCTKPAKMAQFQRTQNCDGVTGDPSMTILSPIEQQLNEITLYSSPYQNILNHHINIVMKRADTGSFRLDNTKVQWSFVPSNPTYMYSQTTVSAGNHSLTADSGFNALAYGFGNVESYGYAAGANIRNLTHYISTSTAAVCKGVATTFIPNTNYTPDEYKWYLADTFYSDSAKPVITFDSLGTFNLALVTINNNQNDCESQDSSTTTITVRQQPEARFLVPHFCQNDTIKFVDSSVIDGTTSAINKWRWEFGDGSISTSKNPIKHYDSAYNFNVTLIATTNHGCADTVTKQVPVFPVPKVGFTLANVCYADSAVFTDTSTIDSTQILKYLWAYGDGQTDSTQHPKYLYPYADTFVVTHTAISDMGCKNDASDSIVIYPRPLAKVQTANVCKGDTVLLTDLTQPTTDTLVQRQWWEGVYFIDTNQVQKWLPVDTGLHNILLWVENNFGCTDTQTAVVDVYSNPVAAYTIGDICYIDTAMFIDVSTIDEGYIDKRLWAFGDGSGAFNTTKPPKKYSVAGTYKTQLITISEKGCGDTANKTIEAFDMPEVKFDINDICVYDTAVFTDYSTFTHGATTARFWQLGDGYTDTAEAPKHKYNVLGSYLVKLKVEVSQHCIDSAQKTITIYPRPKADFYFDDQCVKRLVTFTDTSTVNFGSVVSRDWELSGKKDTGKVVSNLYYTEGKRDIQLVVASQFGCKDTLVKSLTVHPEPTAAFSANEVCLRDTTQFTDNVTLSNGSVVSYQWVFDDGYTGSGKNITHVYRNWGDYSVELIATSDKGCINNTKKTVRVNPLPRADIFTPTPYGCEPFEVRFTDNSKVPQTTINKWLWQFGDKKTDTLQNPIHTYHQWGIYSPKLTVTTDKGCTHDSVFTNYITAYQLPVANLTAKPDSVSFFTPQITLTDASTADVVAWDWSFGDGTTSNGQNVVHDYADTGRYWINLIVRNQNWCSDSARKRIFISPDYTLFIPTAFTPDAGELNPVFGAEGIFKGIKEYQMNIYSRWGEKVFQSSSVLQKWDGNYKGTFAPEGVYIYEISIMDYFNRKSHYRGTVLLFR